MRDPAGPGPGLGLGLEQAFVLPVLILICPQPDRPTARRDNQLQITKLAGPHEDLALAQLMTSWFLRAKLPMRPRHQSNTKISQSISVAASQHLKKSGKQWDSGSALQRQALVPGCPLVSGRAGVLSVNGCPLQSWQAGAGT